MEGTGQGRIYILVNTCCQLLGKIREKFGMIHYPV
jgi:hypothetical protein